MASRAEGGPPKLLGPLTCPSGTEVPLRPSMAPAEHSAFQLADRCLGGNWAGQAPAPGLDHGPGSCRVRQKHPAPSSSTSLLLPTNIHTPRPDVSHLSVPPFSFHPASQRPVSAEDKSQGCGLSTRTQIKITIFHPRMTVTRTQSVPPQSMRGPWARSWPPRASVCWAPDRARPASPHVEAAKLPQGCAQD